MTERKLRIPDHRRKSDILSPHSRMSGDNMFRAKNKRPPTVAIHEKPNHPLQTRLHPVHGFWPVDFHFPPAGRSTALDIGVFGRVNASEAVGLTRILQLARLAKIRGEGQADLPWYFNCPTTKFGRIPRFIEPGYLKIVFACKL